eukprot:symbB.v1.2.023072.t1/scaffold2086.1/size90009/9
MADGVSIDVLKEQAQFVASIRRARSTSPRKKSEGTLRRQEARPQQSSLASPHSADELSRSVVPVLDSDLAQSLARSPESSGTPMQSSET